MSSLPAELITHLIQRYFISIFIILIMVICSIFVGEWMMVLGSLVLALFLIIYEVYGFLMLTTGNLLFLEGTCVNIHSNAIGIVRLSTNSFIIVQNNNGTYKCFVPPKKLKRFVIGSQVHIYSYKNSIYQRNDGMISIGKPLIVSPYYENKS